MSFVSELKRRGVLRVMVAYVAGAWLLLQIADLAFPAFGISDRTMAVLITVVAIGVLPVAFLAWAFDWKQGEIVRDSGTEATSAKSFDRVIIGVLALAVAVFAIDKFVLDPARDDSREQQVAEKARSDALVESFGDRSIAVLPFLNMSSDPEQDYFSDGISEEILNLLARIRELRVISRSSSFAFRGADINIADVAEKLNVGYVLEGSVRKSGNRLRITAQLIEGRTDRHIWSETYDRDEGDVFEIQDEISAVIIDQLKIELLAEAPKAYRTDAETHAMFLRAQNQAAVSGLMGDEIAFELLKQVIERDPDYIPALVRLAQVTAYLPTDGPHAYLTDEEANQIIGPSIARALELDPNNGIANTYTGWGVMFGGGAVEEVLPWFEKGLRVEPNNVEVLRSAGSFAQSIGDFDATLRLGKRAVDLDPGCVLCYYNIIDVLTDAGRLEEAEAYARRRVAVAPRGWGPLGRVLMQKGDLQGALESFDRMDTPDEREWHRAAALYGLGRAEEFAALMTVWNEKYADDFPVRTAELLVMQGDIDAGLDHIDVRLSLSNLAPEYGCDFTTSSPGFTKLKAHPRWKARCGFEADSEDAEPKHRLNLPDRF